MSSNLDQEDLLPHDAQQMHGSKPAFRRSLLDWFREQKRDLPWRRDPSLYKTVVSEFMLQQTQVETVVPYFHRWLDRFPDFASLARASEAEVLKLWEGLGYYRRARFLLQLAKSIEAEGIPATIDEWKQRPGIGPYAAAAIGSIAQGLVEPVIDGNVIRVLTRLEADKEAITSPEAARRKLEPLARELIDPHQPGTYNEALMELGAQVCRKVRPACLLCPVQSHCQARSLGIEESLPRILRKAATTREVHRLWCLHQGALLLHFYPDSATRLAGLAELPEITPPTEPSPILKKTRGISSERIREQIHACPRTSPITRAAEASPNTRWIPLPDLASTALSAPHKRWIQELLDKLC
jgi:A/G-specific adenine glycosylase